MSGDTTVLLKSGEHSLAMGLSGPQQRRSCLIVYSGSEAGKRFVLDAPRLSIGRLADTAIFIDTPSVSRRHAEIEMRGELVILRDLGSSNGTHVNETKITGPVPLKHGDMIRLGKVILKFYEHESVDVLLHDRIYRMATVDAGTDIFNRQYLTDFLNGEFKLARLTGRPLSVIYYDLDFFKSVNDRYGHSNGDLVLKDSAAVVKAALRKDDLLGRLGGEEFVVVLPNTGAAGAVDLAERIRVAVEAHRFIFAADEASGRPEQVHQQTVSLGVAELSLSMQEPRHLLDAADRALYQAKAAGRNRLAL
jgi:two-component system, cell cycle response regulator